MPAKPNELFMKVKSINKSKKQMDIFANCITMDRSNEIIHPKAFASSLEKFMENPVLLAFHDYRSEAVGKFVSMEIQKEGLKGRIEFAPTEQGEKFWKLYSGGYQRAFSVGFIPLKSTPVTEADAKAGKVEILVDGEKESLPYEQGLREVYTDVELLETSCVPIPCNRESLAQLAYQGFKSLKNTLEIHEADFAPRAVYDSKGMFAGMEIDKETVTTPDALRKEWFVELLDEKFLQNFDRFCRAYAGTKDWGKATTVIYGIKEDGSLVEVARKFPNEYWAKSEKSPSHILEGETKQQCIDRKIPELMEEGMSAVDADAAAIEISEKDAPVVEPETVLPVLETTDVPDLKEITATMKETMDNLLTVADDINENILSLGNLLKQNGAELKSSIGVDTGKEMEKKQKEFIEKLNVVLNKE